MRPTAEEIDAARTAKGGWTREILAQWGVPWPPPKGWKTKAVAGEYDSDLSPRYPRATSTVPQATAEQDRSGHLFL
ncbi:MAG: hypothetical protein ACRDS9_15290 [Pseudonocardiaceae bacterium]